MFQLWSVRVDGGNGAELYGEDYADVYALSRIHYMATTNDTCDHVRLRFRWSGQLSRLRVKTNTVKLICKLLTRAVENGTTLEPHKHVKHKTQNLPALCT